MLFSIFKFELDYRFKRPATYLYFVIMFLMAFLVTSTDVIQINGGAGQIKVNAPSQMALWSVVLMGFFGLFVTSAIMGVPVLRDFQHKTESIYFTRPIKKRDYLFGRFLGSFAILLFVTLGLLLGFMIGPYMPWVEADKVLPFTLWHYVQPFLVFILPNLLFIGALFFLGGTLSRNILFVYVQAILLLVLYLIADNFVSDLDNQQVAALVDPFGVNTLQYETQYWTVAEQNSQVVPLQGLILANRLLWVGIGLLTLLGTYFAFSFSVIRTPWFKRRQKKSLVSHDEHAGLVIPKVQAELNGFTYLRQVLNLSRLYFLEIAKSFIFIAIMLAGIALILINANQFDGMYGTDTYPMTYAVIDLIQSFNFFFLIIIVFFSGELIWKERDIRMHLIYDALPMPNYVSLIAKFLGMLGIHLALLTLLMLTGMLIQVGLGYFEIELGLYLTSLFVETFTFLILFTVLALFVQVMVNHKFLGHALMIVFFASTLVITQWGVEHSLFIFASGGMGTYSNMNSFGHFIPRFSWLRMYWYGFVLLLFVLSVLFVARGSESLMKTRIRVARFNVSRPVLIAFIVGGIMFLGSGCMVYYNTNVLNTYLNSDDQQAIQANYEKSLKQYEYLPQPKIVDIHMDMDLYPYERRFEALGTYVLKNKTQAPITDVHLQLTSATGVSVDSIQFEGGASLKEDFPDFEYQIYALNQPLAVGDSLTFTFRSTYDQKGFAESGVNTDVVFNGTLLWNNYFPAIGYQPGLELSSDEDRKDNELEPKERALPRDDVRGHHIIGYGRDADRIRFEMEVSTAEDQIAVAPGYPQGAPRVEHGRAHFHYKMDAPMINLFSVVSARYEKIDSLWTPPVGDPIQLEIYYHKGHEYNLDRMMRGMIDALAYYSKNFSPYQYRQMRIMEFPRYSTYAASFANTVPFSEGIGFILDIDDEEENDLDIPYYVTAHEMAHQWWAHQVAPANVQGSAMLNETMSQYSALMVMKHAYPAEKMQRFLEYELNSYLRGRRNEQKKEMPLELVEGQGYIHYRKGSLAMYALQDYLSEDSVNAALSRYVDDWAFREDVYPTTDTLLKYFREITPDSLQYIITDLFETITLYENRVKDPTYVELGNDRYRVSIPVSSIKYRADSLGNETAIPIADWIDIGVYAEDRKGNDSLIYLKKHHITQEETTFEVEVGAVPSKAGIDPINKLIDRNPDDNTESVEAKAESEERRLPT